MGDTEWSSDPSQVVPTAVDGVGAGSFQVSSMVMDGASAEPSQVESRLVLAEPGSSDRVERPVPRWD